MKTPDITPAQIGAGVAAFLKVLIAFGVHLTTQQYDSINDFTTLLFVVVGADAVIRVGRSVGSNVRLQKRAKR